MARILYFADLVDRLGRAQDDLTLPEDVHDVRALLGLLRARGGEWERALAENKVRVLVNRQFSLPETRIADIDEIAIVQNG